MNSLSLDTALATLIRASAFLSAGLRMPRTDCGPRSIEGPLRIKVLANGLRELDRLLSLLLDEAALLVAPTGFDHAAFGRLRNTSNKLSRFHAVLALPSSGDERLRAVGRSRDCLFHCQGVVRRGDARHRSELTAGWRENALEKNVARRFKFGERLVISTADLQSICALYDEIGAQLKHACGTSSRKH